MVLPSGDSFLGKTQGTLSGNKVKKKTRAGRGAWPGLILKLYFVTD
jgi:hypothetical protein